MIRALTAEHVYGLIIASYQTEAEAIRQHLAETNRNCMQGWLLAGMETVTLAAEIATKAALPTYATRDAEKHDWIQRYCGKEMTGFRQRVNQQYSSNYLQLVKHSAAGWLELRKQKELRQRLDVDQIYDLAIQGKGLTEYLFRGLQQNHVGWKHIDPHVQRLNLVVVAGVPIVVAMRKTTNELVSAQCPALLRFAAEAIIGGATGYQPDRNTRQLLLPDGGG